MQPIKFFGLAALLAGTAFAAPKPPKPTPPPSPVTQTNICGNNVTPYCCNTDNGGQVTSCNALGGGSQCSTTIVCCNAQDSVQVCIGSININNNVNIDVDVNTP